VVMVEIIHVVHLEGLLNFGVGAVDRLENDHTEQSRVDDQTLHLLIN
jgi:hypothetical protein